MSTPQNMDIKSLIIKIMPQIFKTVLSMDRKERKSSILLIIDRMQRNNEPKDMVSALRCLLTDSVAEKALEVLNQEE